MIVLNYQDISLNAKDDLTATCSQASSFSNLTNLKYNGMSYNKYATLEDGLWKLDGTFNNFPTTPTSNQFALWSSNMSNEDGTFTEPVELTLTFANYETSVGLTFQFNTATDDYPTAINVKWYQDDTSLADEDFTSDSSSYFCEKTVQNWNKIVVTFDAMNKGYRYLKLEDVVFGTIRKWDESQLRALDLVEEVSPTSEEISINTLAFTLNNSSLAQLVFQAKQPIALYYDNALMGTFFINTSKRKSQTLYEIEAVDYIGLLDKTTFAGKTYSNVAVSTIVADIIGTKIPYVLDATIGAKTLSGTLEKCTCREALMQVAFATCSVIDTSRSSFVNIKTLSSTTKADVQSGIYEGMAFDYDDVVTEIRVQLNDGETYVSKKNPLIADDALDNILEFEGVFINSNNASTVLDYLFDYYVTKGNSTTSTKFIVENGEQVGDTITYNTEYLGTLKGIITQMKFNFNSSKLVADCELKGVSE